VAFDIRQPVAVIDESYLAGPESERRFVLGRALEPLRGGYALLMRLGPGEREAVGGLLTQLLGPEEARDPATLEFTRSLPRKLQKALERLAGSGQGPQAGPWLAALQVAADRAGLLACDDMAAAARVLVRMGGSTVEAVV